MTTPHRLPLPTVGGPRWMGAVAPIGGMSLMAGWALLAWGVLRS